MSKRHNQLQARSLMLSLGTNMGVNVFEVLAYGFRGDASQLGWWMVRVANFGVFLCNHLLLLFGAMFVIRTIEKDGRPVSSAFKRAFVVVVALGVALLPCRGCSGSTMVSTARTATTAQTDMG